MNTEHTMLTAEQAGGMAGLGQGGQVSRWVQGFLSGLFCEVAILPTVGQ